MRTTRELTKLVVTRFVGPASQLDRRRITILDPAVNIRDDQLLDLSFQEAVELAHALIALIELAEA